MTKKEERRDQLEDALFAYLMEDFIEERAKEAEEENKRLKSDPNAAVPEETRKACLKTIDRAFRKQKAKHAGRISLKILNRVAVIVAVLTISFSTAFATSETVRVGTLNALLEVNEIFADITFQSTDQTADQNSTIAFSANWIPDGFELTSNFSDEWVTSLGYTNSDGSSIEISHFRNMQYGTLSMDTEGDLHYVNINGLEGLLVEKENSVIRLVFADSSTATVTEIDTVGLTAEDVVKVASNCSY